MTTPSEEYLLIPLSQGLFAKVSPHRFEELSKWKWCAHRNGNTTYAIRNSPKKNGKRIGPPIKMHRVILGLYNGDGVIVDHINGDGLDNRDSNLRVADKRINAINSKTRSDNTSGHKGVSLRRDTAQWRAYTFDGKRQITIGCYGSKEEAIAAYERNKHLANLLFDSRH